jgi:hypothetical protein
MIMRPTGTTTTITHLSVRSGRTTTAVHVAAAQQASTKTELLPPPHQIIMLTIMESDRRLRSIITKIIANRRISYDLNSNCPSKTRIKSRDIFNLIVRVWRAWKEGIQVPFDYLIFNRYKWSIQQQLDYRANRVRTWITFLDAF